MITIKEFSTESHLCLLEKIIDVMWDEFSIDYITCFNMTSKDDLIKYIITHAEYKNTPIFIAFKNNIVVGICNISLDDIGSPWNKRLDHCTPWMCNVTILPHERGKGYGTQIVNHVLSYLKQNNYTTIYLWCTKTALANWYSKFGFEYAYGIDNFMKIHDHIDIMVKNI